jgi:type IV pilus assembly protein PilZ
MPASSASAAAHTVPPPAPAVSNGDGGAPPLVLNLDQVSSLRVAYIALFEQGGLFVATQASHQLGDDVQLLLQLPDDTQPQAVQARVAWISPAGAGQGRQAGIGLSFADNAQGRQLNARITALLDSPPDSPAAPPLKR